MPQNEVQRILQAAQVHTESEQRLQARAREASVERSLEVARDRRLRMEAKDAARAHSNVLSDVEVEKRKQSNYLLAKAQLQMDEEQDEIKHLNEMILEAKCMAIRDGQLTEKQVIKEVAKRDEHKLDDAMEQDRVADIARMAQREKQRKQDMYMGAAVIRKQIEEREEAMLLEQERKDQETRHMLAQIAAMAQEDTAEKQRRHVEQHKMMDQVLEANRHSVTKRKQLKLDAQQEDRQLMQYLIDRDREAARKEQEATERKAEREKEISRLRAMQQKVWWRWKMEREKKE